ncbi:MAG: hypothetical protein E7052_05030 [Lentisphaerae bacterium]|nr:hypothetical protein [Lentisphaerota bacterium]
MAQSDLVQSLLRGMELLRLAASRPEGMTLSELAAASNLQKTTAYNLLRTLCARDFLHKDAQNRFQLGPAVFEMASAGHSSELMNKAAAALRSLHEAFPMDVLTFSTIDGGRIRCKLRFSPDRPGELQQPTDRNFPPYLSVTALALQAANPDKAESIERQYPFEEYGEGLWGSAEHFARAKQETLKMGYCWRQSEDRFSIAFIMPEGFVVGFGGEGMAKTEAAKRHKAAEKFKKLVWSKAEK